MVVHVVGNRCNTQRSTSTIHGGSSSPTASAAMNRSIVSQSTPLSFRARRGIPRHIVDLITPPCDAPTSGTSIRLIHSHSLVSPSTNSSCPKTAANPSPLRQRCLFADFDPSHPNKRGPRRVDMVPSPRLTQPRVLNLSTIFPPSPTVGVPEPSSLRRSCYEPSAHSDLCSPVVMPSRSPARVTASNVSSASLPLSSIPVQVLAAQQNPTALQVETFCFMVVPTFFESNFFEVTVSKECNVVREA